MTTATSAHDFDATVTLLREHIEAGGNTIFAVIDQALAARTAGLSLRPTTLIIFGNPKAGTPLMDAHPAIALELPLKLVVWADGGTVSVGCTPLAQIAPAYGAEHEPSIAKIDASLAALMKAVT